MQVWGRPNSRCRLPPRRGRTKRTTYNTLVEKDVISKQQFDAAVAARDGAKAALSNAQAGERAASDGVRVARDKESQSQASLKSAETGPQQVAVQSARAKGAQAQVEVAKAQLD